MNDLALTSALATAPSTAFAELRERPRFWFPLVVLVVGMAAINYYYYAVVDLDWLKDLLFSNNPRMQAMPPDQRAAAMGMMTRTTMLWSALVGAVIAVPLILLIEGFFLWLAAKITKVAVGFKHWFAMAAWVSLPMLLNFVVGAVLLALRDTPQVPPTVMQSPLSINELLIHRPFGSPGQGMLDTLGIPTILTWLLMIVGVHAWTQRSWLFSALFVLLPSVVIYAIWAFIAFH